MREHEQLLAAGCVAGCTIVVVKLTILAAAVGVVVLVLKVTGVIA